MTVSPSVSEKLVCSSPSMRFLPEAKITAYSPGASVSDGIFHSSGTSGSSERYQPARSTLVSPRFAISIQSERSPSLSASVPRFCAMASVM